MPVNKVVQVQVTGADVIHSFTVPSFGVRIDAVPGRMNETWFKAEREGIYYGQCSKICGKDHAFMPIAFRVVSPEQYSDVARRRDEEIRVGARPIPFTWPITTRHQPARRKRRNIFRGEP